MKTLEHTGKHTINNTKQPRLRGNILQGGDNCAEIFVTEGNAERVSNFIGRMRAIRGIEQVKYSVVPLP